MTPQVAERLLYESEAALRLVDSLLNELQERESDRTEDEVDTGSEEHALVSTRAVAEELVRLREEMAEQRACVERADRSLSRDDARLIAARALRAAEDRLDTLARRLDLMTSRGR